MLKAPEKNEELIRARGPKKLRKAIQLAARHNMTSMSDYTRQAILQKLRADGFDPQPHEVVV